MHVILRCFLPLLLALALWLLAFLIVETGLRSFFLVVHPFIEFGILICILFWLKNLVGLIYGSIRKIKKGGTHDQTSCKESVPKNGDC